MALDFENSLDGVAELNLWYKITNGEALTLTDMPEIIRLRWTYFRDNWEFIQSNYTDAIASYSNPDQLKLQIDTFSDFVASQRIHKHERNPFDNDDVVFRFFAIFDNTLVNSVNLTYEEQLTIDAKVNRISGFTRGDFLAIRKLIEDERDALADKANATDEDYNRVFGRSPQAGRVDIKNKDINKMFELQEAIKTVNFILANAFSLETSAIDPFALARANDHGRGA